MLLSVFTAIDKGTEAMAVRGVLVSPFLGPNCATRIKKGAFMCESNKAYGVISGIYVNRLLLSWLAFVLAAWLGIRSSHFEW